MLRFNDESRPYDEVRSTLLPWCSTEGTKFTMPGLRCVEAFMAAFERDLLQAGLLIHCLPSLYFRVPANFCPTKSSSRVCLTQECCTRLA